jgi:predicted nucleic acid-binding protein
MKKIVFDTGPIISLAMNNLLWILEPLKKKSNLGFYITKSVKKELVDVPLNKTKRFKFEALQVLHYIENGTLKIIDNAEIKNQTSKLLSTANNCFKAFGHNMNLIHDAEMSSIALYLQKKADAFVVDEKTTRLLIENPKKLHNILRHKLHTKVEMNSKNVRDFRKLAENVHMIRSVELAIIAYEKGLLDKYLPDIQNPKKTLLESVLWGIKLHGCAVSKKEIEQIVRIETK